MFGVSPLPSFESLTSAHPSLETKYGFFDATGRYVITDVLTPRPWINTLANDRYGAVVSQVGGGFSWYENCQLYRLSKWEQDLVEDSFGRFLYVQDLSTPEDLYSTTFQPTRKAAEEETVVHDTGSTTFLRTFLGLKTTHTIFVPTDFSGEVWTVSIENTTDQPKNLRLGFYLEWHLGGIGDWHREFHRLFIETKSFGNVLTAWKHANLVEHQRAQHEDPIISYVSWNEVGDVKWISDKREFLGTCGSREFPHAMKGETRETASSRWDDPVAAGTAEIQILPGETTTFTIVIGTAKTHEQSVEEGSRINSSVAEELLSQTHTYWKQLCEVQQEPSGNPALDLMTNKWFPYQAIAGRLLARCAYYQQGGAYGYRDQLQDSLMLLDRAPQWTLTQLGRHAEAMYHDGGVRHWWHPDTKIFQPSLHSDTSLWLSYGTLAYLESTDNLSALENSYRYLSRETQDFDGSGDLLDHCMTGINRCLGRFSPRGLPLIGAGDWNDGLSHAGLEGKGESVWMAMFLFDILNRWIPFLHRLGKNEIAEKFATTAAELQRAVNEHAWDGEWYVAGFNDDGKPFGSHTCKEGKFFLNPQTWAVISGIAPPERKAIAMKNVKEQLVKGYGALLLQPAYSSVDPYIGYITRYAPGLRENGGVYSHASTWAVWAFAKIGDFETAEKILQDMLPPVRSAADADLYAAEPYVMPGNVDGPDSPYEGRAGWTWYTGSAAWMVRIRQMLEKMKQ